MKVLNGKKRIFQGICTHVELRTNRKWLFNKTGLKFKEDFASDQIRWFPFMLIIKSKMMAFNKPLVL